MSRWRLRRWRMRRSWRRRRRRSRREKWGSQEAGVPLVGEGGEPLVSQKTTQLCSREANIHLEAEKCQSFLISVKPSLMFSMLTRWLERWQWWWQQWCFECWRVQSKRHERGRSRNGGLSSLIRGRRGHKTMIIISDQGLWDDHPHYNHWQSALFEIIRNKIKAVQELLDTKQWRPSQFPRRKIWR